MQHNLRRPRLIVEVLVFASSHGRPFAYNSYCRVSPFRVRQMSLSDRDTHSGTRVSFSPIPDRRFYLALIVGPSVSRQAEIVTRSQPSAILASCYRANWQINAYDRCRQKSVRLNCSLLMRQEVFCRNNGGLEKLIAGGAFHGVPTSALPSFAC